MGLFDKVLGSGSDKLNAQEGFAGVALCAIAADGVIEQEELNGFFTSLVRLKMFQGFSERQFRNTIEKDLKLLQKNGLQGFLPLATEAIPKELKATAFAVTADLMFADGTVAAEERKVLEQIQRALGVDDALALKIVEVIQIKNMG